MGYPTHRLKDVGGVYQLHRRRKRRCRAAGVLTQQQFVNRWCYYCRSGTAWTAPYPPSDEGPGGMDSNHGDTAAADRLAGVDLVPLVAAAGNRVDAGAAGGVAD